MNTNKLEWLIKDCGKSKVQIARESGITRMTLDNVLGGSDFRVSILEALARTLGVKVGDFFDDDSDSVKVRGNNNTAIAGRNITANMGNAQEEKVSFLEKLLAEKDAMIAEKERMIQMLMERK